MKIALAGAVLIALLIARKPLLELVLRVGDVASIDLKSLTFTPKPNQYLVAPADFCPEKPQRTAPVYPGTVADLKDRWEKMLAGEKDVAVVIENPEADQRTYVQRTPLMRYPDLITVRFLPADGGATLAIYSRSIYGRKDFGANEQRITRWLAKL